MGFRYIAFTVALVLANQLNASAQFQPPSSGEELYLSKEKDMVFEGLYSSYSRWFPIPASIGRVDGAELDLIFSFSDVLDRTLSTITVSVNGIPVKSMNMSRLNPGSSREQVPIPPEILNAGMNNLTLDMRAQSHQDPCEDVDNPANWYVVSRKSVLKFPQPAHTELDLNNFPEPFLNMGVFSKRGINFILGDSPPGPLVEIAANAAMQLGILSPDRSVPIYCSSGKEPVVSGIRDSNAVSFGDKYILPSSPSRGPGLDENTAEIRISGSTRSAGAAVLTITAGSDSAVREAVGLLSNKNFIKELKGDSHIFDPAASAYRRNVISEYFVSRKTFKELGYVDEAVRGAQTGSRSFYFTIPPSWNLRKGAAVTFKLGISPLMDLEKSEMTVSVNGMFAGSTKLKTVRKRPFEFTAPIPEELYNRRGFDILVDFYLDVGEAGCEQRYPDKAWVIIHDDSFVDLPHKDKQFFYLKDFPGQYMTGGSLNPPLVIIPDHATEVDLCSLLEFAFAMGQSMPEGAPWVRVKRASEVSEEDKKMNHLLVLGQAAGNAFFSQINPELPISFDPGNSKPYVLSAAGVSSVSLPKDFRWNLPFEFRDEMGCVELTPSAWNRDKTIMVVTGTDKYLLWEAANLFAEKEKLYSIDANIAILDSEGHILSYRTYSEEKLAEIREKVLRSKLSIFIALVVLAIIMVVIILYLLSKRKK
jgi:hypothetical protein